MTFSIKKILLHNRAPFEQNEIAILEKNCAELEKIVGDRGIESIKVLNVGGANG